MIKIFKNNVNLNKVAGNMLWLSADKVFKAVLGIILTSIIARYLAPADFGLLNYCMAFTTIFAFGVTLGIDAIVIKDLVIDKDNTNKILGSIFSLKLFGAFVAFVLGLIVIILIKGFSSPVVYYVAIISSAYLFQSLDVIDFWYQSKTRSKYSVIFKNIGFILVTVFKILLVIYKYPLIYFIIAFGLELALGSVFLIIIYKVHRGKLLKWILDIKYNLHLLKKTWPLILSAFVVSIYMRLDQVILGEMLGYRALGLYSSAIRISTVWYFIPMITSISVYPTLVEYYNKDKKLFIDRLKIVMSLMFWGGVILCLGTIVLSKYIIIFLYGSEYSDSSIILSVHMFTNIFIGMSILYNNRFVLDGMFMTSLFGSLSCVVSNVLLNITLIPHFGSVSVAISASISYIIPVIVQSIFIDKNIGITFIHSIFYPIVRLKKIRTGV